MFFSSQTTLPLLIAAALLTACDRIEPQEVSERVSQTDETLFGVATNGRAWLAVGGERYAIARVLRSRDAGASWDKVASGVEAALQDVAWLDEDWIFACGYAGKVMRSRDGGENWEYWQMPSWRDFRGIATTGDSTVVVVGGNGDRGGERIVTHSAGIAWRHDTVTEVLHDVAFASSEVAYACGEGVVYRSRDAGRSWELTPAQGDDFAAVACPGGDTVFVLGFVGTVLRSVDGGANWETQRRGDALASWPVRYNGMDFWDANHGIIVGDGGRARFTEDGGESWRRVRNLPDHHWEDVAMTAPRRAVLVGAGGMVWEITL